VRQLTPPQRFSPPLFMFRINNRKPPDASILMETQITVMHENSLKNLQKWSPGQTGNPNGRPTARSRLTERFIADVSLTWEQHGLVILQKMATKEPTRFADLCSRLIPKDVQLTLEARLPGNLDAADWQIAMECFRAIQQAIPDANQRQPGEVMQFVADAIRAHSATPLIDNRQTTGTTTD